MKTREAAKRQQTRKKGKAAFAVLGILFSRAGFLYFFYRPGSGNAEVMQDGRVLYTFSLEREKERVIRVEYAGSYNLIEIKDGRIRVLEADCPDQICVDMGWLDSAAPIVCLPNRLVIRFTDGEELPDAAANET